LRIYYEIKARIKSTAELFNEVFDTDQDKAKMCDRYHSKCVEMLKAYKDATSLLGQKALANEAAMMTRSIEVFWVYICVCV
jgi:hypothetical protein